MRSGNMYLFNLHTTQSTLINLSFMDIHITIKYLLLVLIYT